MRAPSRRATIVASALLAAAQSAAAAAPRTYAVRTLPVAPGIASVEFPVRAGFAAQVDFGALGQGTDQNPFEYLSLVSASAWLHFDGMQNLRLSLAFHELVYREVPALGLRDAHEERGVVRARFQQPRGSAALYEMLQLDVRSFDDAGGTHRVVFRPRFRVGQGFNLDAVRIHSLVLYQEVAFRFSNDGYAARAFEFVRAFAGYTWTTRRGAFVTLGLVGQISLDAPATRYDFLWGPALGMSYRFRAAAPETPPAAEVEVP